MTKAATASRSKISSRPGRVLLISGEDGHACSEAARQLAAGAHGPLDAVRFGHLEGDLYDPRCTASTSP
jgi:2,4-dichlorophenol 6-monooxygenase